MDIANHRDPVQLHTRVIRISCDTGEEVSLYYNRVNRTFWWSGGKLESCSFLENDKKARKILQAYHGNMDEWENITSQ